MDIQVTCEHFIGELCPNGHRVEPTDEHPRGGTLRYASTGQCIACHREIAAENGRRARKRRRDESRCAWTYTIVKVCGVLVALAWGM